MEMPRAWVGCLGCYNDGRLVGKWFAADEIVQNIEDFNSQVEIPADHVEWGHEEIWCFDTEYLQGLIDGECSPVEVARVWEVISAIDEDRRDAFRAFIACTSEKVDESAVRAFEDRYVGCHDSFRDYARDQKLEEIAGTLIQLRSSISKFQYDPMNGLLRDAISRIEDLENHIDWDSVESEADMDHSYEKAEDGGVHVFRDQ